MNSLLLIAALAFADAPAEPGSTTPIAPRAIIGGDETVVVGQMAELTAIGSENAKSFKWIIRPKPLSLKFANKEQSILYVSHDRPEIFEVELVVASADGQLDIQIGELEIKGGAGIGPPAEAAPARAASSPTVAELASALRDLKELQAVLNPQPAQPLAPQAVSPGMSTLAMMGYPQPPAGGAVNWPQAVKLLAERVASGKRAADGKIVASAFRATANRIKVGTFEGSDPWDDAHRAARESLGADYRPWGQFFADLNQLVGGLRQQGRLANPEESILLLESAADALGRLP